MVFGCVVESFGWTGWLVVSVFVVFVDMFFVGFVIDSFIVSTVDSFIVFAINSLVTFSIESFATVSIESFATFSIVFSTPFSIESTTPSLFSGRCGVECSDPSASCDRFLAATGVVGSESERVGVSCVEVVVGGNGDAETERGVGGRGEEGGEEVVVGGGGEEEGEAERGDALDAVEGGDGGPAGDEERS